MSQTYARPSPSASPAATIRIPRAGDSEIASQRGPRSHLRATTAGARRPSFPGHTDPAPQETSVFRPAFLAISLAVAACTSAGIALAADSPTRPHPAANASAPPTGTLRVVMRSQSLQLVDLPPKHSGDGRPSPGDESITTYRVFNASG